MLFIDGIGVLLYLNKTDVKLFECRC